MERTIIVNRHKKSRTFVLHPMGRFKGYGGHVGVYPYREISAISSSKELGDAIVDLLNYCGASGYHIKEYEAYRNAVADEESLKIQKQYYPKNSTTSSLAKQFTFCNVEFKDGQKSWAIQLYRYDSKRRSDVPDGKTVRVRVSDGSDTLGKEIIRILDKSEFSK